MADENLLKNIDSLLFQCALQTRELTQKKNEISQQIQVCKADIAEAKSNIEKHKKNIERLEEDIKVKQNTLTQNNAIAKSMKATNSMILHYEQSLKVELESRKASYTHDREEYEKRISSYRTTFQSHKEYYYKNPLAQKLLGLQAENREIETRIKGYDDQIASKQKELDSLTAPVISTSFPEKHLESFSEDLSEKEPENQSEQEPGEETDPSLQHSETKAHPTTSEEAYGGKIEDAHNTSTSSLPSDQVDTRGSEQMDGFHQEAMTEEADQKALDQDLEQQFTVLEIEQAMEEEMDEGGAAEEDQATNEEANETFTSLSQASLQDTSFQSSPDRPKADPARPAFPFQFSPGRSPQIPDSNKSPAFSFTLHSEPSTPGFFGFGIAQEEDSASPFTSSFFGEKKTTESKTSMEFLFNQPEPSEDFQFSFNAKSPDKSSSSKDKGRDDFPFSFNF